MQTTSTISTITNVLFACLVAGSITAASTGCATTDESRNTATASTAANPAAKPATVEEQIALGGKTYAAACAKCHGAGGEGSDKAPPVVGKAALPLDPPATAKFRKVQFRTALDVAQFVVANMPPPPSPKLAEDEYWAVLAFDLSANGVKLQEMVTPANAAAIVLHP